MILTAAMLLSGCTKEETDGENGGTTTQDTAQQGGGNNGGSAEQGYWVDLGLPSGLLWASCNVGASNPEEYGSYFAWGETQPKSVYDWETYAYYDYSRGRFTKYCNYEDFGIVDNLSTLQASDDAATAIIGNGARIPTADEWQELQNNCTSEWTTKNEVSGRLFTGSNGNTIFLPAAGIIGGSEPYGAGYGGSYWSSSLCTDYANNAWYFHLDGAYMENYDRYIGRPVRPVRSAR